MPTAGKCAGVQGIDHWRRVPIPDFFTTTCEVAAGGVEFYVNDLAMASAARPTARRLTAIRASTSLLEIWLRPADLWVKRAGETPGRGRSAIHDFLWTITQ
jgi:hypothetical protein